MAIALLVALLLGVGAALALEHFNPRINREDELLLGHRLPILARVPRVSGSEATRYLTHRGRLPAHVWEAYRTLRASLTGAGPDGGFPRTILVTSAIPGEGKTMTSVNLAITMALTGVKVILIDADLRRPMIATVFGAAARSNGFGLLLLRNASPELALLEAPGTPNLQLLLSNPEHAHLVDLLQRERLDCGARPAPRIRRRDHHRLAAADRGRRRTASRGRRRTWCSSPCAWAAAAATSSTSCAARLPSAASRPRASSSRLVGEAARPPTATTTRASTASGRALDEPTEPPRVEAGRGK